MEKWHGTAGGYTNHNCRCESCRAAFTISKNKWASPKRASRSTCLHEKWRPHGKNSSGRIRYVCAGCLLTAKEPRGQAA